MRELNKVLQNEAPSRSPKPGMSRFKKQHHIHKIHAKSLGDAFDSVFEDLSLISSKESINVSSISEISEACGNGDLSSQSFSPMRDPEISVSSSTSPHDSDLTQSSEIISMENLEPRLVSLTGCGFDRAEEFKINSLEAEVVINFLRKATAQALCSSEAIDYRSKKLLYGLVEMVIEILQTVPEEKDQLAKLIEAKSQIVYAFCLLCVFTTMALSLFHSSGSRSAFGKPPPT